MKRMMRYPAKAYTTILLLMLALMGACKKDKKEDPAPPIKVSSYFPNSGNAGTLVTIEGENFEADMTKYSATVAGNPAKMVSATASYVVLMTPAGTGSGKIELKHADQTINVGSYTYQTLSVKGLSPDRGPIGTNIRISGEGFGDKNEPAQVTVNGIPAVVISLTDTLIIATVPDKTSTGPVEVKLKDKASKGPNFRVQALYEISPKTGGKGTRITLKGSGFETDLTKNQVVINGKAAQVVQGTETELVVIAPDGVTSGMVALQLEANLVEGPNFTVVDPPLINLMTPLSGPAGTDMKITGTGYSVIAGETKVSINGKDATITAITATEITLNVPESTGTGALKVSVNDQVVTGPIFTEQAVGITRFSPENGSAGTVVTIYGVGFSTTTTDNVVTFNGITAHVTSATPTQLVVVAPPGVGNGSVKVRVNGKEAVSPKIFQASGVLSITTKLPKNVATSFCVGLHGEFYVAVRTGNQIYKVAPDGTVTLYAGDPGMKSGNIEGIGTAARFTAPVGIVMDSQGTMFVAEVSGNIKKIAPNGMVTMYKEAASIGASGLAIDKNNTLYIGARPGSFFAFVYITANGTVNYNYDIYTDPEGRMGIDGSGAIYASDVNATGRNAIGDGTYERLIGDGFTPGYADGDYSDARFGKVGNMVWNKKDLLMVCDPENNALRSINPATKQVGTIFKAAKGFQDGGLVEAKFGDITDVNVGPDGSIYVLDKTNGAVRKITL